MATTALKANRKKKQAEVSGYSWGVFVALAIGIALAVSLISITLLTGGSLPTEAIAHLITAPLALQIGVASLFLIAAKASIGSCFGRAWDWFYKLFLEKGVSSKQFAEEMKHGVWLEGAAAFFGLVVLGLPLALAVLFSGPASIPFLAVTAFKSVLWQAVLKIGLAVGLMGTCSNLCQRMVRGSDSLRKLTTSGKYDAKKKRLGAHHVLLWIGAAAGLTLFAVTFASGGFVGWGAAWVVSQAVGATGGIASAAGYLGYFTDAIIGMVTALREEALKPSPRAWTTTLKTFARANPKEIGTLVGFVLSAVLAVTVVSLGFLPFTSPFMVALAVATFLSAGPGFGRRVTASFIEFKARYFTSGTAKQTEGTAASIHANADPLAVGQLQQAAKVTAGTSGEKPAPWQSNRRNSTAALIGRQQRQGLRAAYGKATDPAPLDSTYHIPNYDHGMFDSVSPTTLRPPQPATVAPTACF